MVYIVFRSSASGKAFLRMSHNAEAIIGKINKLDFIKIRNVRIKKKKRTPP